MLSRLSCLFLFYTVLPLYNGQLSSEDVLSLVNIHNALRRTEGASDMRQIVWNHDLAGLAQDWVDRCQFGHNPDYFNKFGFRFVGENLYLTFGQTYDTEALVRYWFSEKDDYIFNNLTCKARDCGHYTQVVWASTYALGCGVKWCPDLGLEQIPSGTLLVCNYGPAGNSIGDPPYTVGASCTKCPQDANVCDDRLCAVPTETTTASTTPTTLSTTTSSTTVTTATTTLTTPPTTPTTSSTTQSSIATTPTTTSTTEVSSLSTTTTTPTSSPSSSSTASPTETSDPPTETITPPPPPQTSSAGPTTPGYIIVSLNAQLIQNAAIFGFFLASVSICFMFQIFKSRMREAERKDRYKPF